MFIVTYRYKIKKSFRSRWGKIMKQTKANYRKLGDTGKWQHLLQTNGNFYNVLEIGTFKSEKAHAALARTTDQDSALRDLYKELRKGLHTPRVIQEKFKSIDL
jgi:hypothetical protein